jgi:hypothetical protein
VGGENGTILRWNGISWAKIESPATVHVLRGSNYTYTWSDDIQSIHGTNSNNVWAVSMGEILKWDGVSWQMVENFDNSSFTVLRWVWSIRMLSENDGWVVMDKHDINENKLTVTFLRWNGTYWSEFQSFENISLKSLGMLSSSEGLAVGSAGMIARWDGINWSFIPSPTTTNLCSVHMLSSTEGWAVGGGAGKGIILRWKDNSFEQFPLSFEVSPLLSVYALSSNEGWAVGAIGTILRWDGTSWTKFTSPTENSLWSLHMPSPTDGWAVGSGGPGALAANWRT